MVYPGKCRRSYSGAAVRGPVASSRFGLRKTSFGPRSDPLELPPTAIGCGFSRGIRRVVLVELPLPIIRYEPENTGMAIGHDRAPRFGRVIETAVA